MSKDDNATLVVAGAPVTDRLESEEKIEIGQWYWCEHTDYRDNTSKYLGIISHIGSNYVEFTAVGEYSPSWRVHMDDFDKRLTRELQAEAHVNRMIEHHRVEVATLLDKVKQLTASLGIVPRDELPEQIDGGATALAVANGTADIEAHKQALIKAKKETLPDLFKKVEHHHKQMAVWMQGTLLPMKADLDRMKSSTDGIEDRIFTVELYAGLTEKMVLIQDGEAAPNDTKVSLFQRRHYMDEECLVAYEAGGMDYQSIEDFDKWLLRPQNLNRILPLERCIVAFRIRRHAKYREGHTLSDHIRIMAEEDADKTTFLFIRNGQKVFRLNTAIDFGEELFPDKDKSTLLNDSEIWLSCRSSSDPEPLTRREKDDKEIEHKKERDEFAKKLWAWKREGKKGNKPWKHFSGNAEYGYEPLTKDHIYYDDVMEKIQKAAKEHNRVAVVLQGLLDRSPALHPHPPWQLWKPDGFMMGIDLVYDNSRVITSGDMPDFEEYRRQLNKSIKRGSMTMGQHILWRKAEAVKENEKRDRRRWRSGSSYDRDLEYFTPYGNPGPGEIAEIKALGRNGTATFEWERQRQGVKWVRDPENPGYMKHDDTGINTSFTCKVDELFNVSAYTPGDFKMFYSDPRTRAQYLEWAPFMLAAEDYHAGKAKKKRR
jgi:hypothetical protein